MQLKDFLNSINYDKKPLMDGDDDAAKIYPAFIVNKCLSYFIDTIFHSNEMNCKPWSDPKMQFDFHRTSIRKKKRYSPWVKKEDDENIAIIRRVYNYNESKAREVLNIIGPNNLDKLKKSLDKGGPTS